MKAGVDFRQTTAYLGDGYLSSGPIIYYYWKTAAQLEANQSYEDQSSNLLRQDPVSKNLGVYLQDEWRVTSRLNLSLGMRWDFNPAPVISGAQQYTYSGDINNPASLQLAPLGTAPYKSTYTDIAPRLGLAYVLSPEPGHELVLRVGGRIFYDTGQSTFTGTVADGYGLGASNLYKKYSVKPGFPILPAPSWRLSRRRLRPIAWLMYWIPISFLRQLCNKAQRWNRSLTQTDRLSWLRRLSRT